MTCISLVQRLVSILLGIFYKRRWYFWRLTLYLFICNKSVFCSVATFFCAIIHPRKSKLTAIGLFQVLGIFWSHLAFFDVQLAFFVIFTSTRSGNPE